MWEVPLRAQWSCFWVCAGGLSGYRSALRVCSHWTGWTAAHRSSWSHVGLGDDSDPPCVHSLHPSATYLWRHQKKERQCIQQPVTFHRRWLCLFITQHVITKDTIFQTWRNIWDMHNTVKTRALWEWMVSGWRHHQPAILPNTERARTASSLILHEKKRVFHHKSWAGSYTTADQSWRYKGVSYSPDFL